MIGIALAFSFLACKKNGSNPSSNPQDTTAKCVSGKGGTDIDGNAYTSVIIGKQEWMGENLKVTKYRNGVSIPNVTNGSQWAALTTGAWCYYSNDAQYNTTYGKLYNWYAVADTKGLAPTGWHVATDAEISTLITYLGGQQVAGARLKESGLVHWATDNYKTTNNTCFTGLPGGNTSGSFIYLGSVGYWWSGTDAASAGAYSFTLSANSPTADRGTTPKYYGYSVRCIKD